MSDFLPEREGLRRAVQWISEQRRDDPEKRLGELIEMASQRFDLGPLDEQFLLDKLATRTS